MKQKFLNTIFIFNVSFFILVVQMEPYEDTLCLHNYNKHNLMNLLIHAIFFLNANWLICQAAKLFFSNCSRYDFNWTKISQNVYISTKLDLIVNKKNVCLWINWKTNSFIRFIASLYAKNAMIVWFKKKLHLNIISVTKRIWGCNEQMH